MFSPTRAKALSVGQGYPWIPPVRLPAGVSTTRYPPLVG